MLSNICLCFPPHQGGAYGSTRTIRAKCGKIIWDSSPSLIPLRISGGEYNVSSRFKEIYADVLNCFQGAMMRTNSQKPGREHQLDFKVREQRHMEPLNSKTCLGLVWSSRSFPEEVFRVEIDLLMVYKLSATAVNQISMFSGFLSKWVWFQLVKCCQSIPFCPVQGVLRWCGSATAEALWTDSRSDLLLGLHTCALCLRMRIEGRIASKY